MPARGGGGAEASAAGASRSAMHLDDFGSDILRGAANGGHGTSRLRLGRQPEVRDLDVGDGHGRRQQQILQL